MAASVVSRSPASEQQDLTLPAAVLWYVPRYAGLSLGLD